MKQDTIRLGDKEFVLKELPLRKARAWRAEVQTHFGDLTALLEKAPGTEVTDMGQVAGLMRMLSATVFGSIDKAADLLYAYSPELAEQKEWIEDNAGSSEIVDAFLAALGLSFPFFGSARINRLIHMIQSSGSKANQTLTN